MFPPVWGGLEAIGGFGATKDYGPDRNHFTHFNPHNPCDKDDAGFSPHRAFVDRNYDVMFTSDGQYLVSASGDKTVRVWDVRTGEIVRVIRGQVGEGSEGAIYAVAFSSDNSKAVTGSDDDTLKLWDANTGRLITTMQGHNDDAASVAFTEQHSLSLTLLHPHSHKQTLRFAVLPGKEKYGLTKFHF